MRLRVAIAVIALGGAALAGAVANQRAWSQGPGPQPLLSQLHQTVPAPTLQKAPSSAAPVQQHFQKVLEADPAKLLERIRALEQKVTALETRFAKHKHVYHHSQHGAVNLETIHANPGRMLILIKNSTGFEQLGAAAETSGPQ